MLYLAGFLLIVTSFCESWGFSFFVKYLDSDFNAFLLKISGFFKLIILAKAYGVPIIVDVV